MSELKPEPKKNAAPTQSAVPWEKQFVREHNPGDNRPAEDLFWQDIDLIGKHVLHKSSGSEQVSKKDLASFIQHQTGSKDERQVAAALYDCFDKIKSSDNIIGEAELNRFVARSAEEEKAFKPAFQLSSWASGQGIFKQLSTSQSGFDLKDLDSPTLQKLSADDQSNLRYLQNHFSNLADHGKISESSIGNYIGTIKRRPDYTLLDAFQTDMRLVDSIQKSANANKLFADQAHPLNSISADGVRQGFGDDCAFKAALAALAQYRPKEVLKMIAEDRSGANANDTHFLVKFPGSKGSFGGNFSVDAPTDATLGLFATNADHGYWPAVLSRAYGMDVYAHADEKTRMRMDSETQDQWAGEQGLEAKAIEVLTGHKVYQRHLADISDQELAGMLREGHANSSVMVLTTAGENGKTVDGYKNKHAFSILQITDVDGRLSATVRDPQGMGSNRLDGTTQAGLAAMRKNFDAIYIEMN